MGTSGSVLVAMSGGVDSSVAACLLAEGGYQVLGSYMELVHPSVDGGSSDLRARADAEEVARIGGFPFEVVDVSEVFERAVLADYFSEYAAGRTPNPCIRCNQHVKFGALLDHADELGIDFVATGHYARSVPGRDGRRHLMRGADAEKDQSYMLHMLGQRELARSLFPLGGMRKTETRRHAERLGLSVAAKADSQELCFVPDGDRAAFIETFAPSLMREGEIVDREGNVLGQHRGAFRFTVGQRRGLGVSTGRRMFVLDVDAGANRVMVGPAEESFRCGLVADGVSWVAGAPPAEGPFESEVRIRYRGDDLPAVSEVEGDRVNVRFRTPQKGVAPGQSVVFYRGEELLGGARILEGLA